MYVAKKTKKNEPRPQLQYFKLPKNTYYLYKAVQPRLRSKADGNNTQKGNTIEGHHFDKSFSDWKLDVLQFIIAHPRRVTDKTLAVPIDRSPLSTTHAFYENNQLYFLKVIEHAVSVNSFGELVVINKDISTLPSLEEIQNRFYAFRHYALRHPDRVHVFEPIETKMECQITIKRKLTFSFREDTP